MFPLGKPGFTSGVALAALALAVPLGVSWPTTAAAQDATAFRRNVVSVAGRERGYVYHVPPSFRRDGFNFVVYLVPDDGQSAEDFARQTGWLRLADEQNFTLVVLQPDRDGWARNSGGEDAYLKTVYDDTIGHLAPGAPGGRPAEAGRAAAAGGAAADVGPPARARAGAGDGPPRAGDAPGRPAEPQAAGGGDRRGGGEGGEPGAARMPRVQTWVPFHYISGAGTGATIAQEFVINHPGVFAAIATFGGAPFDAAYARGGEAAQGYFQKMRPGKNAAPLWKQLKREVPVAAWMFTPGEQVPAGAKLVDYWKRSDAVAAAPASLTVGGFHVQAYRNPVNPAQQIRTTQLDAAATYDPAMSAAIWNDFFAHTARWSSSANGDLGTMMTEAEVKSVFDVRALDIGGKTYTYYVKAPSTYRKGQSLPLVVAAHGAFFPAWLYASQVKMHEVGEREGFVTVYVNGQQNRWDFTTPDGGDAKFIEAVVADLTTSYGIDRSRVYMQGFSLGSGISYMMGITHPQLFAAVSPNNGIGPMSQPVHDRVAELKAKGDVRMPMMIVYGDVDTAGSVDATIPAYGVLKGAIDEIKAFNNVRTPDRVVTFNSPNAVPYDQLVPGGRLLKQGIDKRFPDGRFQITSYDSADPRPLNLFNFVWVRDMSHGQDSRTAQLEWDYFKHWRRNPDGSLLFDGR
ncbi:MAG: Poly(3-hydroxybutyrate) depolymerase-like protein [Sphingomonas bacterium]|nr:Poly(3-hydroxybutyrate) depolymerase-like protein [Sphingomonas bacterium]